MESFGSLISAAQIADMDGSQDLDIQEWKDIWKNLHENDRNLLFKGETYPVSIFHQVDKDKSGSINFHELAKVLESSELSLGILLSGMEPCIIQTTGDMISALVDTLYSQISSLRLKQHDAKRTVPIDAGHVSNLDWGAMNREDMNWLIENGKISTRAFLFRRKYSSSHRMLQRCLMRARQRIRTKKGKNLTKLEKILSHSS